MRTNKRFTGLIGMTLVAALAVAGCGGQSEPSANAPAASGTTAPATAKPDPFAKKIKLTMYNAGAFNPSAPMPPKEEDTLRQMLEKAVNVDLDITIPVSDSKTKLNTMIAAGDVPDMIYMPDRTLAVQFYEQGVTAELDAYLNDYPALKARFAVDQWSAMKYKGKTIGTPGSELVSGINGWWIRNDWLTKLNLKVPTTTDELLNVMKAFTFNDPDGNGKADTYGFLGGVGKDGSLVSLGWGQIMWMFGVAPDRVDSLNGNIVFGNTDPRMKEALAYAKQMLDARVVDPDWVSINDAAALNNKRMKGKTGIMIGDWRSMEPKTQEAMKEASGEVPDWILVAPPKGPHGDQVVDLAAFQSNSWAISSKAAKDPEKVKRILALLQYWYTDKDAQPYYSYGLKGIHWDIVNGKPAKLTISAENNEKYKWATNYLLPRRADDPVYFSYQNPKTADFQALNLKYVKPNLINPYVVPDPADTASGDRLKYIHEMLLKFMNGKEPLDNWDAYLKTLDTKFDYANYKSIVMKQLKDAGAIQ